ncbi:MAG: histidine phosphotransferase family protein [Sphingobium sp.]
MTMADGKSIDYASLLCSRLCHDLLSPVGALNNGLELLAEESDPGIRDQCMALLGDSARISLAKLTFYRLAFGAAGGKEDLVSADEVKAAVEGMFAASGRLAVEWMIADAALPRAAAKVLLNFSLIAGEALPRGGTLMLALERVGDATDIAARGEGLRLALDANIRRALTGKLPAEEISSRTVAATMVRSMVLEAGGEVMIAGEDQPFLMFGAHIPG